MRLAWVALLVASVCRTERATPPPSAEVDAGPPPAVAVKLFIAASKANVRSTPDAGASLVTKLRIATPVTAEMQGEWAKVTAHGHTGWVLSSLLEAEQPTVPSLLERFDHSDGGTDRRKFAERAT